MKQELLEGSIEALSKLRDELCGKVEDCTIQKLDKIINDLNLAYKEDPRRIDKIDLLKALGVFLEAIPAIAELLKLLSGLK